LRYTVEIIEHTLVDIFDSKLKGTILKARYPQPPKKGAKKRKK